MKILFGINFRFSLTQNKKTFRFLKGTTKFNLKIYKILPTIVPLMNLIQIPP
jgi:hypothetical protein